LKAKIEKGFANREFLFGLNVQCFPNGRSEYKVYKTSSAWMPMRATWVKQALKKRSFVRS
jgi:hypothetical protein